MLANDSSMHDGDCASMLDHPLLSRCAAELNPLLRSSIRLLGHPINEQPEIGVSKLGGQPDLPAGTDWPTTTIEIPQPFNRGPATRTTVRLAFVAQINLCDIHPFDIESLLPKNGMLSFFFKPYSYEHGSAVPSDWQVIYTADDTLPLERKSFPEDLDQGYVYNPHKLSYRVERSLPSIETSFIFQPNDDYGQVTLTAAEYDVYRALRYDKRANHQICHMLGYADQFAMPTDECSYWSFRDRLFPGGPDIAALSAEDRWREAASFRPLLQLEVFDNTASWWSRNGLLYFFIRDIDLRQCDFSKVWGAFE